MTVKNAQNKFADAVWAYYDKHRRDFPWRNLDWKNATEKNLENVTYRVVVSEIMLQQTQAPRVVPRYERFIQKFADWRTLARASTTEVLTEWQGLGYNRRALYLKQIAEAATARIKASVEPLPRTADELRELPGIGPNTAGSILAFAFNIPHSFIETNIRSVFINFFFETRRTKIHDKEIMKLITKTLDTKINPRATRNPREWYYALMDYGAMLKQEAKRSSNSGNNIHTDPSHKSVHHVKQSKFKGSNRELRAELLRNILKNPGQNSAALVTAHIAKNNPYRTRENILKNLEALEREGFIQNKKGLYTISN